MANDKGSRKKIHIGGTIDSDVAEWLMKTKGAEKFSAHLNEILRDAMGGSASKGPRDTSSLKKFNATVDDIRSHIKALQNRVESLEAGVGVSARHAEAGLVEAKRPRGRPRKVKASEEPSGPYDTHADINWFISHDRYKKVKPQPMENALNMVIHEFDKGGDVTVGTLKQDYNTEEIGVPYPTFKLFYFPLIRDRLQSKGIIQKVEHAGKKGVYRKR